MQKKERGEEMRELRDTVKSMTADVASLGRECRLARGDTKLTVERLHRNTQGAADNRRRNASVRPGDQGRPHPRTPHGEKKQVW